VANYIQLIEFLENLEREYTRYKGMFSDALEVAKDRAYVFADMGSINADSNSAAFEEYKIIADIFLEKGINNFYFETRNSSIGLKSIGEYIKEKSPEAFIIASFAVMPDGYSSEGYYYKTMFKEICESGFFDGVGLNCVSGANHMAKRPI